MIIYGGELVPSGSATVIPVTGFAITGSNQFNGSQTITGSLLVSGSSILTGSLFVTNDVTSSQLRATTGMVAPNVTWTSTLGSNGGEIRISQTQFRGGNNITQVWSQTTDSNGTRDLGIRRNTTGSLEIYDGNTADGAIGNRRDLLVRDVTGSNATFSGNVNVNGNIIAQQYIVSSSVTYLTTSFSSGSSKFGDTIDDTHQFTGSLNVSGSQNINGTLGVSIAGSTELSVQQTGVILGNIVTDAHRVTGSLNVSGSITTAGALLGTSATFNHNDAPTIRIQRNGGTDTNTVLEFTNSSRSFFIGSNGTVMGIGGTSGAIGSQPLQITSTGAATFSSSVTAQGVNVGANALGTDRMFQVSGTAFTSGTSQFGIVNNPTMSTPTTIYGYYGGVNVTSATNAYGIYITAAVGTITNKFGIYQEGSGDKNYFAGNIGIGASTAPVYKLEVSTASGSERIRVGTLQNNSNTATFEAITSAGTSTATSGWIRAVYGGGLAIGTSTYTKANGDSGNFANLSSESATVGMTVETSGTVSFSKTQKHSSNLWHVIPFGVQKGNGAGSADSRTIIEITSDTFHEYFIHINYGARLQNLADSQTYISSRMYGVNRFNSGAVAVTDSAIMAGSGGNINTHAPITAVVSTSTKVIVKVDFSTSCAAASFVWGEIRLFSWEGFTPTIVNNGW